MSLGYRVSIFTDFFQRLPTPKSRQSSRVFLIGGRCRRKEAQVYCPRAIWWPTANHLSLSLSLFFHTFYELIEPPRTRILSDASSLNSLIKYAGIIYSSLRFASFFSPFILFPLFDTFSLPLPSLLPPSLSLSFSLNSLSTRSRSRNFNLFSHLDYSCIESPPPEFHLLT